MFGLMVENMKVHGKIIRCMGKVLLFGLMGGNIKENMFMRRNKGMVSLVGLMAGVIKDNGATANKMAEVSTPIKMEKRGLGYGAMAKK